MEGAVKEIEFDGVIKHFDAQTTFESMSSELRGTLTSDRVLAEIYVDDHPVDLTEEERINALSLKDLGRVVVKSRRVDELFKESLLSAPQICEALKFDCQDVETFLNESRFEDAHERVIEMTALLEWLIQLVIGSQSLGTVTDDFSKQSMVESITRMQYQLVQLHFHLGSQNWDEFKKVLTSSFREEIGHWEKMFLELANRWVPQSSTPETSVN